MTDSRNAISTDLSGQVALVTGATSGLGRRFAQVVAGLFDVAHHVSSKLVHLCL